MFVITNDQQINVEFKSSSNSLQNPNFPENLFTPFSLVQNLQRIWGWSKKQDCRAWWDLQCWWTKFFKFSKRISNKFENTVFRQLFPFEFQIIIQKLCIFWKNSFWRKCAVWKVEYSIFLEFFKFFRKIKSNFKYFILGFCPLFKIWFKFNFPFKIWKWSSWENCRAWKIRLGLFLEFFEFSLIFGGNL